MARNRKRAKERRARRPQPVPARVERDGNSAPNPLGHATPDAELAEAQLAVGRPDLAQEPDELEAEEAEEREREDDELEPDELEPDAPEPVRDSDGEGATPSGRELAASGSSASGAPGRAVGEPRAHIGNRLINFIQGSWRELQRVQWPDRRQVVQATGVVIGFVIVAGVFLGVADTLASKLVTFILK